MRVSPSVLAQILTVLVCLGLASASLPPSSLISGRNDDCVLQQTTVPVVQYISTRHNGRTILATCTGNLPLHKCEGMCESSVSPSVRVHPGFVKECRCCKETSTIFRDVMLTNCSESGRRIPGLQHQIRVTHITGCFCLQCMD